jgi:hypothetical protein
MFEQAIQIKLDSEHWVRAIHEAIHAGSQLKTVSMTIGALSNDASSGLFPLVLEIIGNHTIFESTNFLSRNLCGSR